jgi:hypothetical protein
MADRYVVLPSWMVRENQSYDSPHEAAVAASELVGKDRTPRTVVKVFSEISVAPAPQVQIVQISEGATP